jgi:hypothetical protein
VGVEWYHLKCVGLTYEQAKRAKFWYCEACENESESEDSEDDKPLSEAVLLERGARSRRPSQRYKHGQFLTEVDGDSDEPLGKAGATIKVTAKKSVSKGGKRPRADSDDSSSDSADEPLIGSVARALFISLCIRCVTLFLLVGSFKRRTPP